MSSTAPVSKLNLSISFPALRTITLAMLFAVGLMPIFTPKGCANELDSALKVKIAQTPNADLQRRLENQREAERVLKEGERLKREVRDNNNGYNDRGLGRQVGEQVNKVRESGSNPQKVREAETELNRLRQQNNRRDYYRNYYNPFYYPNYNSVPIIFAPEYRIDPTYITPIYSPPANSTYIPPTPIPPSNNYPEPPRPQNQLGQIETPPDAKSPNVSLLVSSGFKDGKVAPGIGARYNNIGFEFAGIFNQDSLPGTVNDFSLPSNFLFNDLGVKKLSPQWGGDVLGFLDVDPRVSVYGSVGLYLQSTARIAQSQATQDLYKQTDETNVTGAVGGGVAYKASDSISIGVGYHSLRGVTARMGISF